MTNFDYLKNEPKFDTFSDVAIAAEKIFYIDPASCILGCRRAMEFAIKWMYSVDSSLCMPYQDTLISLMSAEDFKDIIDEDLMKRMHFIRKMGNNAAHTGRKITEDQAVLCLENLQIFFDFICYCYADEYEEHVFDKALIPSLQTASHQDEVSEIPDVDIEKLIEENKSLKDELTARREEQAETYIPKPLDLSMCVPSTSDMSDTAACPPSPIADDPSALPSPTSSPSSIRNSSGPFTPCQPPSASCCTVLLYFSRSCTVRLKMFSLSFVLVFDVLFV